MLRRVHGHLCGVEAFPTAPQQQHDDQLPSQPTSSLQIAPVPFAPAWPEQLLRGLQVPEAERVPIFDQRRVDQIVKDSFDADAFARDGYHVWPGVMLPEARTRWIRALQSVQQQNDRMILHDWSSVSWEHDVYHSGWTGALPAADNNSPGTPAVATGAPDWHHTRGGSGLSAEARAGMIGGGQLANHLFAGTGVGSHHMNELRVRVGQGFLPECFPPSHSPFLFDVVTHPQMLRLHRLMLGQEIRFDHCTLLNRLPSFRGQGWHSHSYAEDGNVGSPAPPELGLVRTIAYPDGFSADGDGGVRLVPGAHLFRATHITPGGTTDDDVFQREWLHDKTHPVTGEALVPMKISVPPGSLVSFLCNMPHAVDSRAKGHGTRWSCVHYNPRNACFPSPFTCATPFGFLCHVNRSD
jgi:hypothetical protein